MIFHLLASDSLLHCSRAEGTNYVNEIRRNGSESSGIKDDSFDFFIVLCVCPMQGDTARQKGNKLN